METRQKSPGKTKEESGNWFVLIISATLIMLFLYTSMSKFLDYDKFVFQMHLAPVPMMKTLAPLLGWLVPVIELVIALVLAFGFFDASYKKRGLYASVILLSIFELYIAIMLLSGSHLPCTCGGLISTMGWKEHLFFNGFFIITGMLSIRYSRKQRSRDQEKKDTSSYNILSRA